MKIREILNRNPAVAQGAAFGLIVLAVGLIAYQALGNGGPTRDGDLAFYSADDGATYFADDINKISGFDHDGRPAYRARVFRSGDGDPFVGYLERYTPEAREQLAKLPNNGRGADPMMMRNLVMTGQEIKRPGDAQWYKRNDPKAQQVLKITAPDGSREGLEPVHP